MLNDTEAVDAEVAAQAVAIAETEPAGEMLAIKVTKGGTIAVDLNRLPDRIYKAVLVHGLQKLINRKSKSDKTDVMKPMERAEANLTAMYANTFKLIGSKVESSKASHPVMVEARRLAKLAIKAEIKAGNIVAADGSKLKVAHVAATEYTRLANELIEADKSYITAAEANLKAAEKPIAAKLTVSIDPKLVKAAEDKKAKAKATAGQTLSAKQAGKVQVKSKPQATK